MYIRLRTLSVKAKISKTEREKQQFVLLQCQKTQAAEISRFDFVKIMGINSDKNWPSLMHNFNSALLISGAD